MGGGNKKAGRTWRIGLARTGTNNATEKSDCTPLDICISRKAVSWIGSYPQHVHD